MWQPGLWVTSAVMTYSMWGQTAVGRQCLGGWRCRPTAGCHPCVLEKEESLHSMFPGRSWASLLPSPALSPTQSLLSPQVVWLMCREKTLHDAQLWAFSSLTQLLKETSWLWSFYDIKETHNFIWTIHELLKTNVYQNSNSTLLNFMSSLYLF